MPEEVEKDSPEGTPINGIFPGKDFDVELSLCGEFFLQDIITPWEAEDCLDIFYKYEINFEDFCFNPAVASDPNLIVRINGRMYRSAVALPYLISLLAFRKPPTKACMKTLVKQHWKERVQSRVKSNGGGWKSWFRRGPEAGQAPSTASTPTVPSTTVNITPPSPQSSPIQGPLPPPFSLAGASSGTIAEVASNNSSPLSSSVSASSSLPKASHMPSQQQQQQQQPALLSHAYVKSVRLTQDQLVRYFYYCCCFLLFAIELLD